jgi:hypothetical protein
MSDHEAMLAIQQELAMMNYHEAGVPAVKGRGGTPWRRSGAPAGRRLGLPPSSNSGLASVAKSAAMPQT